MVMPFVPKSLSGCLSVDSITEEVATPMVSTPFPTEELDGHNQTISYKVELGVLIPSCHQTNITLSRKYSYKVKVEITNLHNNTCQTSKCSTRRRWPDVPWD